jgi:hypothetical protein
MFSWIGKLFKKIIKFVLKFWFVILILVIIFAPILAPVLASMAATLPAWIAWAVPIIQALAAFGPLACLILGVGLAYLVFPEETAKIITSVAEKVGEVIGGVAGAVASGLGLGKIALIGGLAWLGYTLFIGKDDDDSQALGPDTSRSSLNESNLSR